MIMTRTERALRHGIEYGAMPVDGEIDADTEAMIDALVAAYHEPRA